MLLEPWRARGRRRKLLRAGIVLALGFDTWRALVRDQGLGDEQAIEVVLRLTDGGPGSGGAGTTAVVAAASA